MESAGPTTSLLPHLHSLYFCFVDFAGPEDQFLVAYLQLRTQVGLVITIQSTQLEYMIMMTAETVNFDNVISVPYTAPKKYHKRNDLDQPSSTPDQ
jgi:hypothetical protein